jgi:hypothetical protein
MDWLSSGMFFIVGCGMGVKKKPADLRGYSQT